MIKPAKFAILLVLIVLFSGCTHIDPDIVDSSSAIDGMDFEVYADTLQPQIYEGATFGFQVLTENKGSYTIPTSHFKLYLEGINPLAYNLQPEDFVKENSLDLTAIGIYNDEISIRGQEVLSFDGLCYKNDLKSDLALSLHLKSCYSYETNSKLGACFGEAYSQFNEICTVTEQKSVTNTVAPIQITEIYESAAGQDNYRFIVKVSNQGSGSVFSRYTAATNFSTDLNQVIAEGTESCRDLTPGDSDIVYIESIKLDGNELLGTTKLQIETKRTNDKVSSIDSSRGNYFNLMDGNGQFIFKFTETTDVDYVGTLEIVLGYGYTETKIRNTELVSLPDVVPDCQ